MKLIIFGPPGSGKGTYAQRIAPRLEIMKISTGDVFREIAKGSDSFAKKIAGILKKGELVEDEIAIRILEERISRPEAGSGYILDGFPRTIFQAEFLTKNEKIDAILNVILPREILVEKALARRICSNPKCDGNYNIADIKKTIGGVHYYLPPLLPKREGICDKCGGSLYQRPDDNHETVENRLNIYEKQSRPLIEYYKKLGLKFIDVYVTRPPEEIVEKILKEIKLLFNGVELK